MLTNGELTLLPAAFGLVGVVAGAWLTNVAGRRQQQIEANLKRREQRAAIYEDILVEVMAVTDQHKELVAGRFPAEQIDQAASARLRARAELLAADSVRIAYKEWGRVLMDEADVMLAPSGKRDRVERAWEQRLDRAFTDFALAMRDDLDQLAETSRRWRLGRFVFPGASSR